MHIVKCELLKLVLLDFWGKAQIWGSCPPPWLRVWVGVNSEHKSANDFRFTEYFLTQNTTDTKIKHGKNIKQ